MARMEAIEVPVTLNVTVNLDVEGEAQSNFDDVGAFHEKFLLPNVTYGLPGARLVTEDVYQFRLRFLREELEEFEEGWLNCDSAQMFDALLDLVYVAMGTAQLFGYPWQEGWDEVQRANMSKVRASSAEHSAQSTGRGHAFDVVKPEGFVPPDIRGLLARHGFELPPASDG